MKQSIGKIISFILVTALVLGFIPSLGIKAHAVTLNQQNIADRADFFFNTTWVCQKEVNGWRDQFTFYEGETYHLPYGQPVNSGEFIGYGVELEDFLIAAADVNSVYYSRQSEYRGWTSVYYATDCAAFVAMCWGTVRQDCSTLPYYSTYMGNPTLSNIHNILQLGDALDSTSVGHVVLVSDLIYDSNGNLIQIEITEQTPPQLKRTYFTPEELADKYAAEFGIYRYEGSVPAVPEWGYTAECTNYSSYCQIEVTQDTPIMSLPCASETSAESTQIGTAALGSQYIATRMYDNTAGELWYRIALEEDQDGYIAAGETQYIDQIMDDIVLTDASYPNAHVRGKTFSLVGNLYAKYNQLVTAATYIYKGFGSDSTPVTGYSDYVTSNAYTLKSSTIDYNTSFGDLTLGQHTIAISATYKNHYATSSTTYEVNTGTVDLAEEYFMVVSSATNQSYCNHSYSETVLSQGSCTEAGLTVYACSSCGHVYKETSEDPGHNFEEVSNIAATCTEDGSICSQCSVCGEVQTQVTPATGHSYTEQFIEGSCQETERTVYICNSCGHSYTVYSDEIMTPWQPEKPEGIDEALIETKTEYRYSDYEEIISEDAILDDYDTLGETWQASDTNQVEYVKTWPGGFDTGSNLYSQYNGSPLTAWETDSEKLTIDSDKITGYLYYHWCYNNSYYSQSEKSNRYTIFHAYYSTTPPSTYRVDESDWSYCTAHSTCSNSEWFFVAEVNTQSSTTHQKMYRHGHWLDYSPWSDVPTEATDTRLVETRTVYRYADTTVSGHDYGQIRREPTCTEPGSVTFTCSTCGDTYSEELEASGHSYEQTRFEPTCTEPGSVTFTCSTCGDTYSEELEASGHSYEQTRFEPTCTEPGSVTFTCSTCGDTYSEELSAAGHTYSFTVTHPSCSKEGYTTYTCNICGYSYADNYIPASGHSFNNGACSICGEQQEQAIPAIVPKYPTLSFEDEILLNVYFTVTNPDNMAIEDMGLITWTSPMEEGTIETANSVSPGAVLDSSNGFLTAHTNGIAAKNLGDNVYFKIYIKLADSSYVYSSLLNYSPKSYAKSVLSGNGYSAEMKALVVAMLNYGAAAQTYFGHNPYNLMNADLSADELGMVETYTPSMISGIASIDNSKLGNFVSTGTGFSRRYPTISFEGAFCINYYFTPNQSLDGNMTLYVWNQNDFQAADLLTVDNATAALTMSGESEYWAAVTGIAAKEIDRTVFVCAVYTDSDGQRHCSGILNYSIGAYCVSQAAGTGSISPFAAATAVYGYYAKNYFTK